MTLSPTPAPDAPKTEWRSWARATRGALPDRSAEVTAHLRGLLHAQGARRVLAYRALPGEPDVSGLAEDFTLLAPRARFRPTPRLTLHAWDTATEPSRFGALQPPVNAPEEALATVDAVLLPALAYDRRGVRLGYGGGFYDRLLPDFGGLVVGVTWAPLVVPELPSEAHDSRAGWLATEEGVARVRP
ncbi:5-formyltetrahydrofolate cyclo-ligase [Deinococcus sp. Leaf326]|uniref:5-formyltetrahydrofolate cyclo-ligase n=1 Tax=Deinococcus sp. Leaf326 TaxID=1736338 RepID=UPI0006FBD906|nr:5-formyltetrahydrofolate cyclo-ligase [Deinococcus sp. Leaf326]KQR04464.1 5-formyltetrahydrofolate cyclo-ligase [Deinococcus sp. Leaf326]